MQVGRHVGWRGARRTEWAHGRSDDFLDDIFGDQSLEGSSRSSSYWGGGAIEHVNFVVRAGDRSTPAASVSAKPALLLTQLQIDQRIDDAAGAHLRIRNTAQPEATTAATAMRNAGMVIP